MKMTRCATLRAKPISWVTTIMVMPSLASSTITSSTSLIISGSSAEVGSSKSIAMGSSESARVIATRCCCPPESCPGNLSLCASRPTRSRSFSPLSRAASSGRPSTFTCASVRFLATDMCGNSSKFWNTMPMRERSFERLVLGSPTETPSTVISPFWKGSRPFTVLMSVDLPLPEGPQTTTTSPLETSVVQSVSTWKAPYHLLTFLIEIMDGGSLANHGDSRLQAFHQQRKAERNDEVDHRGERIHLDQAVVAVGDLGRGAEEIGRRDHVDERSVLEEDDRLREEDRHHVAEGLRQHDVAHGLPVVQPERIPGPHLPARDRLDSRAHDLAVVRRLEHREGDERGVERPDLDRARGAGDPRADVGHEEEEPEDHQHQRDRAHQVHVPARDPRDDLDARQPHHREDRPEEEDRKSTRLNSSHTVISYAVFCLKKKKHKSNQLDRAPDLVEAQYVNHEQISVRY